MHICQSPNCTHSSHSKPLVNFHLHTSHSSLDGCGKISDYIELAKQYGHPGIAITDHGTGAGIFDFYREVTKAGLKPVLGEEFYLCVDLEEKQPNRKRELLNKDKHQIVLIKDNEGYKNFCKLTYLSYTEGYYYKPRVSYEMLFENKKGLIISSGCAASMFNQLLINNQEKEAEKWFRKFVSEFGDDFYGEIQFNELNDVEKYGMNQFLMNEFIIKMCNKYEVPLLIGGDTHYARKEDSKLQDIVIGCQRRKESSSGSYESFIHARHLYYHSSEDYFEFNKKFNYNYDERLIQEALDNSVQLLNKVNFAFETNKINFPVYKEEGVKVSNDELLKTKAYNGLTKKLSDRKVKGEKFSKELIQTYIDRLDYELEIIKQKNITDYFLIVSDLLTWAKRNDIFVGAGRGSAAGSLVSYAVDITEIDSIKFGLLFERFQNPERTSLPDIDCDIEQGGRERVREYLETRYGKDSVLGVGSFHIYRPKSAIEDAARGMGLDTSFQSVLVKEVVKMEVNSKDVEIASDFFDKEISLPHERRLPFENCKDIKEFFDWVLLIDKFQTAQGFTPTYSYEVIKWVKENEECIYWANKLLGQVKNVGTHAGGILITPGPVYNYIPVTRAAKEVVTAFKEADGSSKNLSELGLLKLDILGLKTLNVIKHCISQIKADLNIDISDDVRYIDLEDKNLYKLFNKGNNIGIFQLEGRTQDGLIKTIKPDSFDDIVAINAINRPGPLETFSPVFGKWKKYYKQGTPEKCQEDDIYPKLDFMLKATEKTFGCLLYQEQLMEMLVAAADFNMGEADSFRRAIAWREDNPKYHTVKKYFEQLKEKMLLKGYNVEDVEYFLDYCREFMGYAFNLSHSCLTKNTLIKHKEKGDTPILEIKEGDEILTYNTKTQKNEYKKVKKFYIQGKKKAYKITTRSGKILECTDDHKIMTPKGMLPLKEILKQKLSVKILRGIFDEIVAIEELGETEVYDLGIDSEDHNFFANEVLVHNCSYSYIGLQTLYLKCYYPAYFFANLLNYESNQDDYQLILSNAISNGIEILPPSVTKSKHNFSVENNKIRIGLKAIKGFGASSFEDLLKNDISNCKTIDEVLSKPLKPKNFTLLLDAGAFDEYVISREKIAIIKDLLKEKKITTWFNRKHNALTLKTIPPILQQFDEEKVLDYSQECKNDPNPHYSLVLKLTDDIKVRELTIEQKEKKQEELLGFSLKLAKKLNNLHSLANQFPELNLKSITTRQNDNDICYWFLLDRKRLLTKRGTPYFVLEIGDSSTRVKAKCWTAYEFLIKGKAFTSRIKEDKYGYSIIEDDYLMELPLEDE